MRWAYLRRGSVKGERVDSVGIKPSGETEGGSRGRWGISHGITLNVKLDDHSRLCMGTARCIHAVTGHLRITCDSAKCSMLSFRECR
jgi:hypothetical protein